MVMQLRNLSPAIPLCVLVFTSACNSSHEHLVQNSEPPVAAPPPVPKLATTSFPCARLDQFLTLLSSQNGVTITPLGGIEMERVTLYDREGDLETILTRIAQPKGWTWWRNADGSYDMADQEWYRANTLCGGMATTKVFRPDHVRAADVEMAIRPLLTPGTSRIRADSRTNKLVLVDNLDVIELVSDLLGEMDTPATSVGGLP